MENAQMEDTKDDNDKMDKLVAVMLMGILLLTGLNSYLLIGENENSLTAMAAILPNEKTPPVSQFKKIDVFPKGVPNVYGPELGVRFDDVSPTDPKKADLTIKKLGTLDTRIVLEGNDLKRYISITSRISCEYCCGAEAIITKDGEAACDCAHSFAMRGLAKYLIRNHPTEFSDDDILEELGKWKTLFFPDALAIKAAVLKEKGIALTYINLASNKYRGIEKSAAGTSMIGGC